MSLFASKPSIKSAAASPQSKSSFNQLSPAHQNLYRAFNIKRQLRRHSQNKLQCFDFTNLNPETKQIQIYNQESINTPKSREKAFRFQNIYKKQASFRLQQNQVTNFIQKKNIDLIKQNIKKMQQNQGKSSYYHQRIKSKIKPPSFGLTMKHNSRAQKIDESTKNDDQTFRFNKQVPYKNMKKAISFIEQRKKQFHIKNNYLKQKRKTQNNLSNKKIGQQKSNQFFNNLSLTHLNARVSKPKTTGGWLVKYKHPDSYFL